MRAGDDGRPAGEVCGITASSRGCCFKVPPSPASVWWYKQKWEQNKPPLRSERRCVPYSLFVNVALAWLPFTVSFYGWDPWNDSAEIRNWDDFIPPSFQTGGSVFPSSLRGYFIGRHGWDEKCLISPLGNSGLVSTFHTQAVRLNKGEERCFFFLTLQLLKLESNTHTSIFHRVIKYKCQFSNTVAHPRKRPPPPFQRRLFSSSSSCLLLNSDFWTLSPRNQRRCGEEEGAKWVVGIIPLMPRRRLKSFVSHKQTSRWEKLPPPTFPAVALQLLNPSVALQLSLCISLRHFMSNAPGLSVWGKRKKKNKINIWCCYLNSNACRLLSPNCMFECECRLTWQRWERC